MRYIIAGIVGGIIGGLGMGGGTLLIPILTVILGMEQRSAQFVNLLSFIPMAIVTVIINAKRKLIKWKYMLYVSVSGVLSAIVASLIASYIDGRILKYLFGGFLIILGLYFVIDTIVRMWKKKRAETLVDINITRENKED